ncbi:hypothetical protein RI367_002087 [Sorochytrium milnesiophthora]
MSGTWFDPQALSKLGEKVKVADITSKISSLASDVFQEPSGENGLGYDELLAEPVAPNEDERIRELQEEVKTRDNQLLQLTDEHQRQLRDTIEAYRESHRLDAEKLQEAQAEIDRLKTTTAAPTNNAAATPDLERLRAQLEEQHQKMIGDLKEEAAKHEQRVQALEAERQRTAQQIEERVDKVVAFLVRSVADNATLPSGAPKVIVDAVTKLRELSQTATQRAVEDLSTQHQTDLQKLQDQHKQYREEQDLRVSELQKQLAMLSTTSPITTASASQTDPSTEPNGSGPAAVSDAEYESRLAEMRSVLEFEIADLTQQLKDTKADRDQLSRDYQSLLEKLSAMKTTLAPKLQAEMNDAKMLRQRVAQLTADNESNDIQITNLQAQLVQQIQHCQQLKDERDAQEAKHQSATQTLQEALEESYVQINELQRAVDELHAVREVDAKNAQGWVRYMDDSKREQAMLQGAIDERTTECERLQQQIEDLQGAIGAIQHAKDSDIQYMTSELQSKISALEAELQAKNAKIESVQNELAAFTSESSQLQTLQTEINDKNVTIGKLRYEIKILHDHLKSALGKIQEMSSSNASFVDKQVIANMVVSFCSARHGDPKRFQTLQLLSSVLDFSEEQKCLAGLVRRPGGDTMSRGSSSSSLASPTGGADGQPMFKDSFSDRWISFLLSETQTEKK